MKEDDLYKLLFSTITTTVRPRNADIELDDQAPLALVICIALPVFIGFIILVLIYCFCRRKPAANSGAVQTTAGNTAVYHRAPENDGMGMGGIGGPPGGGSYPMTVVPNPYPGGFPTGPASHMVPSPPPSSQGYRMGPQGMAPSPLPASYPSQQVPVPPPPHFGGVPAAYPPHPHQFTHPIYLPPPSHPHTHSLSHSSQASSNSATTADPLVPSSPPQHHHHHHLLQQQQQQHQQQQLQQHQQYLHQQQLFHHHQQQQQQHHHQMHMQSISGRDSPATLHQFTSQPSSYPLVQSGDHAAITTTPQSNPDMFTSITSSADGTDSAKVVSPAGERHSPMLLQQPQSSEQDLGYSDEEE